MKVLCINNANPLQPASLLPGDMIYVGDVYTVHDVTRTGGREFFILKERMNRWPYVKYLASRFIPLSDIDERELLREREEENASARASGAGNTYSGQG